METPMIHGEGAGAESGGWAPSGQGQPASAPAAPALVCPTCGRGHAGGRAGQELNHVMGLQLELVQTLREKPAATAYWTVREHLVTRKTWHVSYGYAMPRFEAFAARLGAQCSTPEQLIEAYRRGMLRLPSRIWITPSTKGRFWELDNLEVLPDAPPLVYSPPLQVSADGAPDFPVARPVENAFPRFGALAVEQG